MELRNNNREIISMLSKESYRNNKGRNRLLIGAVALAVITVFSVFSIARGRIDAECLMYARAIGMVASTSLDEPSQGQYEQIKQLSYIETVGKELFFAKVLVDEERLFVCSVVDETAFVELLSPAYTGITGTYPKSSNEVMLPMRALEKLDINDPKIGMELDLEIYMDQNKSDYKTFILSGYYTDYGELSHITPTGYFSVEYLDELGFSIEEPSALLIQQTNTFSGESVEESLYNDIETISDHQQFLGGNTLTYDVVLEMLGGYDIACAAILIILLCVYLLIHNVMNISVNRDVRHYGLLKTLGTTNKQIRNIIYRQMLRISITGIAFGTAVGCGIVLFLIPKLLGGYYLDSFGGASGMMVFYPLLLLAAIGFSLAITFIGIIKPAKKAADISPITALHYMGQKFRLRKEIRKTEDGSKLSIMAWRNIFRNKKDTLITIASLSLGLIAALSSVVVVTGTDYTNSFEKYPDFSIGTWVGGHDSGYTDAYLPMDDATIDQITNTTGITDVDITYGGFARMDADETAWLPLLKAYKYAEGMQDTEDDKDNAESVRNNYVAWILIVDDAVIDQLEKHVDKNGLAVDIASLRAGTGTVVLHNHKLSEKLTVAANALVGEEITVNFLNGENAGTLSFGGYVDYMESGYPDSAMQGYYSGMPNILMSEKGLKNLGFLKKAQYMDINVQREMEPIIKENLNKIIEAKNEQVLKDLGETENSLPAFYINVKSEGIASARNRIRTIQIVMYSISSLLMLLGVLNYMNVTTAGLIARRKELAVMESIGMTRKQLQKMLSFEGIYYSSIISIILLTFGNGILFGVGALLKIRLPYAKFMYPYLGIGAIIILLFIMCMGISRIIYRNLVRESVIERLRYHVD